MKGILTVLDFEGSRSSGIFEAGWVVLADGEIAETGSRLYQPKRDIAVRDLALCRLTEGDFAGLGSFADEYPTMVRLRRAGLFAAHHASTEHHLLVDAFPFPPWVPSPTGPTAGWGPWVDTLILARRFFPDLPGHGLETVTQSAGIAGILEAEARQRCPEGRCQPHAALYDALAAALLLRDLGVRGWVRSVDEAIALSVPGDGMKQSELF